MANFCWFLRNLLRSFPFPRQLHGQPAFPQSHGEGRRRLRRVLRPKDQVSLGEKGQRSAGQGVPAGADGIVGRVAAVRRQRPQTSPGSQGVKFSSKQVLMG